jgi:hypothetical protein
MRRALQGSLFVLALAVSSGVASNVRADGPAKAAVDPITQQSDALFLKGNDAYKAKDYAGAEQLYKQAWALKKTYDTAANYGLTELKLGKMREAAELLDFALHNSPPSDSDKQREQVKARLDQARAGVGAVNVKSNVEGASYEVDGVASGEVPAWGDVYVTPGVHTITLKMDGYSSISREVKVELGQKASFEAKLEPRRASRAVMAAGFGLAAAGVGAGLVFTLVSIGKSSSRKDKLAGLSGQPFPCGEGTPNTAACADISDLSAAQNTFKGAAIASFAVGGAALVGTIIYAVSVPSPKQKPKSDAKLLVGPGSIAVSGSF